MFDDPDKVLEFITQAMVDDASSVDPYLTAATLSSRSAISMEPCATFESVGRSILSTRSSMNDLAYGVVPGPTLATPRTCSLDRLGRYATAAAVA